MTKVESAARWMTNLANDNTHGYSWGGWGPQDYDCGHAVITAYQQAGVPVKDCGATYTGDMREAFLRAGFYDVTSDVDRVTGGRMRRGDVLLNEANHAAMYLGNGQLAHARGTDGHPEPGDQTGNEIRIQSYFNYPWDCVLRYPQESEDEEPDNPDARHYPTLRYGDGLLSPMEVVRAWQMLLICWGYDIGKWGADGEFGVMTLQRTRQLQKRCGIEEDGIVGEETWKQAILMPK